MTSLSISQTAWFKNNRTSANEAEESEQGPVDVALRDPRIVEIHQVAPTTVAQKGEGTRPRPRSPSARLRYEELRIEFVLENKSRKEAMCTANLEIGSSTYTASGSETGHNEEPQLKVQPRATVLNVVRFFVPAHDTSDKGRMRVVCGGYPTKWEEVWNLNNRVRPRVLAQDPIADEAE